MNCGAKVYCTLDSTRSASMFQHSNVGPDSLDTAAWVCATVCEGPSKMVGLHSAPTTVVVQGVSEKNCTKFAM